MVKTKAKLNIEIVFFYEVLNFCKLLARLISIGKEFHSRAALIAEQLDRKEEERRGISSNRYIWERREIEWT